MIAASSRVSQRWATLRANVDALADLHMRARELWRPIAADMAALRAEYPSNQAFSAALEEHGVEFSKDDRAAFIWLGQTLTTDQQWTVALALSPRESVRTFADAVKVSRRPSSQPCEDTSLRQAVQPTQAPAPAPEPKPAQASEPKPPADPFDDSPEMVQALETINAMLPAYLGNVSEATMGRFAHFVHDIVVGQLRHAARRYERREFRKHHPEELAALEVEKQEARKAQRDAALTGSGVRGLVTYEEWQTARLHAHAGRPQDEERMRKVYDFVAKLEPYFEADKRQKDRAQRMKAKREAKP